VLHCLLLLWAGHLGRSYSSRLATASRSGHPAGLVGARPRLLAIVLAARAVRVGEHARGLAPVLAEDDLDASDSAQRF